MPFAAKQQRTKIPVTIITGFLGAGKTTLLNYLLKERGNKSIAVIENEFGEVNIDRELVADNLLEKEDLVSLENGCVCCSLRKDIVKAFAEIERRSRRRAKNVDAIIMETTGLADPAPVAFTFFANPWVANRFKLDSIICVVDARYLLQHLDEHKPEGAINEAVQQIAFSDLILLNKIDLVDEEGKENVVRAIRKINSTASLVECQLNEPAKRPSLDKLLGINSFSISKALEVDPNFLHSDSEDEAGPEITGSDGHHHHKAETRSATPGTSGTTSAGGMELSAEEQAVLRGKYKDVSEQAALPAADGAEACTAGGDEQAGPGVGSKRPLEDPCEEHCRECEEEITQQTRRPKRRRKKLHDLSDVSSVGIVARGALDEYRFNMFMRDILAEKAKDIFRCKGVLAVHGYGSQKFVFQGVHETICYGPCDKPWRDDEPRLSQIVFIGRGLDRKALMEGFRSCVWVPLPNGWEEARHPITKQPYYVNRALGQKSWTRPEEVCAVVYATHASTEQPPALIPRKGSLPAGVSLPSPLSSAAPSGPATSAKLEQQAQVEQKMTSVDSGAVVAAAQ
mmetsp:Transcript_39727/g.88270  ORF Transcript_39727/g.88270 Transcript_39727/m.88270 type:complete len:568 (-) Transcript_39727:740-2443(-)|eukprot:CAMPEP_0202897740 /NCGR_PEP_ID=MMETSP1392-20130828/6428_1 /ASSEMBLY_ACC=CAM_ASM_000868 /TAXON_ID=225041 /ORGANISM="Chlamydomonas chlamydogama, Strain SAG 11-48b" /LENGTH=567 /DNA_ID=CAMNT_0049583475 /DNA_START=153 /DNA_END=1856 /DNA_ORIENTATION=-